MSASIFPVEKMDSLLALLIPEDARKEGGPRLQERLRNIFDVAARIGYQQKEKEVIRAREEGYEAGKKEGLRQLRAAEASSSILPTLHSISIQTNPDDFALYPPTLSLSTIATQTDPPDFPDPPHTSPRPSLSKTAPAPSVSAPAAALSDNEDDADADVWHEAPEPAPDENHPPSSPSPSTFTRDFSDLRTGTSRPFASLQRRHKRAPRSPCSRSTPSHTSRAPKTIVLKIFDSTPKTTHTRYPNPPLSTSPSRSHPPPPACDRNLSLDWGHDPRLCDLSRALTALGWVRPG